MATYHLHLLLVILGTSLLMLELNLLELILLERIPFNHFFCGFDTSVSSARFEFDSTLCAGDRSAGIFG